MLADFVNGKLKSADMDDVEQHLDRCGLCLDLLSTLPADSLARRLESANLANAPPVQAADGRFKTIELGNESRYQILEELGTGGMGQVFKARHKIMKRTVALKTIRPEFMNNDEAVRRFAKEARAAARLSHPNIVSAFDAEHEGDVHFLVMEYVEGESLHRLVNRTGPLDASVAIGFVRQAAEGLQHACERGMVHRDIKPQNLMRATDGTIKILDFGLSKFRREQTEIDEHDSVNDETILTLRDTQLGTEGYMAPEQARDASTVDIRSDIYSLGCTLFFLLTNRAPFFGLPPDKPNAIPDIRRFRNDLVPGVAELLEQMMAHEVGERFQRPDEIVAAIDAIDLTMSPVDPGSAGVFPEAKSWVQPVTLIGRASTTPAPAAPRVRPHGKSMIAGIALGIAIAAIVIWLVFKLSGG
jgi:eukaryotic-like serine/threonine-protein kinase